MTVKSRVLTCGAAIALTFALPTFGEDAYIESDGSDGAGINTGFFVGPETKIEIDFQLTASSQNQARLFGARGTKDNDSDPECECYVGKSSSDVECFSFICAKQGARQSSNFKAIDTLRHRIVLDFYEAKEFQVWTGTSKSAKALEDFPANRQLNPTVFFCKNYAAAATYTSKSTSFAYPTKMRVYGFRIWDAGVLVRDYTPCVKGSRAGFKENCSGQFVTGENIKAFTAGGDVDMEKDDPYIWSPRNIAGTSGAENNIYLDTGHPFLTTTRVELDYAMLTNSAVDSPWTDSAIPYLVTASTTNEEGTARNLAYWSNKNGYMSYSIGSSGTKNIACLDPAFTFDKRRTIAFTSSGVTVVTEGYTNFTESVSSAFDANYAIPRYTLRIGCNYAGDGRYSPMKIYGIKIFESDVLVKDYVPFVANGVGGLRNSLNTTDTIFSKTRTSYSATVSDGVRTNVCFDVGGDIACADVEKEDYLEFDGKNTRGHYLLTDNILTKNSRVDVDFSLWNTKYNGQQRIFDQSTANRSNCILARLYINSSYKWALMYGDNQTSVPSGVGTVSVDNSRLQFAIDSYNSRVVVTKAGVEVYNQAMTTSRTWESGVTNLWIGGSYGGASTAASMRLYSFKISEAGTLKRNYVPCVHNGQAGLYDLVGHTFSSVTGAKVSGATINGDTFQIAPQPARLIHKEGFNSATLTCLAVGGAQSYEWYEDGVKIEGATSDSYTVNWKNTPEPYIHVYSVKPVYTVFNEKVLGDAVSAVVEMSPRGTVMILR